MTSNSHILIVADRPDDGARVADWLTNTSWKISPVCDLAQALQVVRVGRTDLVISTVPPRDVQEWDLPGVLRAISPRAHLPVLVVTELADVTNHVRCLESGADMCLTGADLSGPLLIASAHRLLGIKTEHDQLLTRQVALKRQLAAAQRRLAEVRDANTRLRSLSRTDPLTALFHLR